MLEDNAAKSKQSAEANAVHFTQQVPPLAWNGLLFVIMLSLSLWACV